MELDLFTAIGEGADAAHTLAVRCQAAERGIRILCDYLVVIGFLPRVAVVLLSIWRSPVDRRELARMLTDIYRVHLGTRLSGAFYPLGAVIAGALVFAFMLYLPFVAGYGAVRVHFYRAVGRSLPYDIIGRWVLGWVPSAQVQRASAGFPKGWCHRTSPPPAVGLCTSPHATYFHLVD